MSAMSDTTDSSEEWNNFSSWIHCICTVTFDLELGQALELVYPPCGTLTEKEKTSICYLSFPDSNSGFVGDTQFHFRFRRTLPMFALKDCHQKYNEECPPSLAVDPNVLNGFVYFRQVKDKTLPRGYFQKSVVLITHLPFFSLFTEIVKMISPGYFASGFPSLEAACYNINQWPALVVAQTLNLPILGSVIQVRLSSRSDKSLLICTERKGKEASYPEPIRIIPHDINLYEFYPVLPFLQLLWELILVGEPLVVMGLSPVVCSQFVESLIRPNVVIGVTNPFFSKALRHWPHVIRLGMDALKESEINGSQLKKGSANIDGKPGIYSRYTPFLNKDKVFLKRLFKGIQSKRPAEAQNALIRRHFYELTQNFVIPLERYIASMMPLRRNITPFRGTPRLRDFDMDEFFMILDTTGPSLVTGIKGDWAGLYRRFFDSPNFAAWFAQREREVNSQLELLHLESFCSHDLVEKLKDKSELELINFLVRMTEKSKIIMDNPDCIPGDLEANFAAQIENVQRLLPEDVMKSFLKS